MSKEPRLKKMRRIGSDLSLTSGIRPIEDKGKLNTRPGVHGAKRTRVSDYGKSLQEKQRFCISYGLRNHQLRRQHGIAMRLMRNMRKQGKEAEYNLLIMLEARLDRVVYRIGWGRTNREARQLVVHKAILVNGKTVNKPGFEVKLGDVISVHQDSQNQDRIHQGLEIANKKAEISWITKEKTGMSAVFSNVPKRDELPPEFKENYVIQIYSK